MIFDRENMAIAVDSIRQGERETAEYQVPVSGHDWDLPDAAPAGSPAMLTLRVTGSGETVVLEGSVSITLLAPCARCLEPVQLDLEGEIRRVYSSDPAYLSEPDIDPLSPEDGWISILAAVREAVMLAMPRIPLCDRGCMGLCAVCGVNLNKEKCVH